jgi:hypothetical protein
MLARRSSASTSARDGGDHVGIDIAGRDRVDGDADARAFLRQRLGEAVDAGFGGGVIDLAILAGLAVDRADVDDAADTCARSCRPTVALAMLKQPAEIGVASRPTTSS